MPSLLMKDGQLVMRSGSLVTTENPALCDCCNPCDICCRETLKRYATITISGVANKAPPSDCDCLAWNDAFELELFSLAGVCAWETRIGLPCGSDPRLRLLLQTCEDGSQTWHMQLYFKIDDAIVEDWSLWYGTSTDDPIDCDTFWTTQRNLTVGSANGTHCSWFPGAVAAVATIDFHD